VRRYFVVFFVVDFYNMFMDFNLPRTRHIIFKALSGGVNDFVPVSKK